MHASLVILAATGVQAIITMGALTLPAVATIAAAALGVEAALVGLQISLLYGVAMIAALFGGRLVRRYGACRTSQLGLLFLAAGCAMAAVPWLPAIALGSAVIGISYGLPNPAASHLLIRFTEVRRRNLIFSIKQTGVPLGGAVAGLVGPSLGLAFGWQAPLLLTAFAAVLLAAALQVPRESWDDDRHPAASGRGLPLEGFALVLHRASLRWLALAALLLAGIQLCVITFLVVLLVEELGATAVAAGALLASTQVASVIGRIVWGWMADRSGSGLAMMLILIALLATAAIMVSGMTPQTPWWMVTTAFLLLGATAIGWNGVFLAEVARLSPVGRVGDVTACILFFTFMGVFAGPATFTFAQAAMGGFLPAYLLLAAVSLVAMLAVAVAWVKARASAV